MNADTHGLFRFFNTTNAQNTQIFIWQPRWNMITPVFFAGALTIFAGALAAPVGLTLVTGSSFSSFVETYIVLYIDDGDGVCDIIAC